MIYNLTDYGDTSEQFYDADMDCLINRIRTDETSALCMEHQKYDGFTPDRGMRLIAHVDLDTVKFLAAMGETEAHEYYYEGNKKSLIKMIRRHPELFKACSGGI